MAAITGKGGSVKINTSNTVGEAKEWSITPQRTINETTPFGKDFKTKIYSLGDWTAKVKANWDPAETLGQVAVMQALLSATTVTFAGFMDATHNYSGTALVKQYQIQPSPGATIEVDFDLDGSDIYTVT